MKVTIHVSVETDDPATTTDYTIGTLERAELSLATLGLTLDDAKTILAGLQEVLVTEQVAAFVAQHGQCPHCNAPRPRKGQHDLVMRTLFGTLTLESPRLYTCACQETDQQSFSPLAERLPERTTPERRYLQAKWAALLSFDRTVAALEEVFPLQTNHSTVVRHVHQAAERLDAALGPEQTMFAEGCQRAWEALPPPEGRITVGLDGAYVHAREGDNRTAGWFEVIVGKSIPLDRPAKCFSFVQTSDTKPKRRLFEVLKAQGLQMNQDLTFLSDGGATVRELQLYLSPESEHILDWFHVTMRITQLQQQVNGLAAATRADCVRDPAQVLGSVKWYLWHGNVFRTLQELSWLADDVEAWGETHPDAAKLAQRLWEFHDYISNNRDWIPNYGERYRYGERIATGFTESAVNQVVSKRMVKQQQMRWTKQGAHRLLQVRVQVLNDDLRATFGEWYPEMERPEPALAAAA